ncbi:hypothetical protein [Corallibacter sp.]|uniref:hypothetical protein n=1 Tax=Corallibacter sp. TaxID=2038084 RepID=UPI003A8CDDC5
MKISSSKLLNDVQQHFHTKIGDFYFFEKYAVVEYAENVVVSMPTISNMISRSKAFYGTEKQFGLIVNKVNNYSTIPSDAMKLESELKNLVCTAVVSYNLPSVVNFDLENHFFKAINRKLFSSIEEAEKWVLSMLIE